MSGGDEEIEIEDLPEDILPFKKPDFYGEESTGYGNENREFGVELGVHNNQLFIVLPNSDDPTKIHLRSSARHGKDSAQWCGITGLCRPGEKIDNIAIVAHTCGDSFGSIQG